MAKREIRPIRVEGQVAYVPLTKGYTAIIDTPMSRLLKDSTGARWSARPLTARCARSMRPAPFAGRASSDTA